VTAQRESEASAKGRKKLMQLDLGQKDEIRAAGAESRFGR
jgi:hypothetical protein